MILKNQIYYRANNKPIVWDAYFNANNSKKPLVIFCHGYKGFKDWGAWNLVAEHFSKHDLFFVKFNFSHNGGTVENPVDFPDLEAFGENNYSKELDDLGDVLNVLCSDNFEFKNDIDTSNITLIGHSRGGGISILKASEDSRITKLITWASVSDFANRFGSKEDIKQWKSNGVKYVLNGRTKQQMPHYFQFFEDYKANEQRLNIKTAVKNLDIPFLIIHATGDTSVSFQEAINLHTWNPNSKLLNIEHSNHVFDSSHPWPHNCLPPTLQHIIKHTLKHIEH